MKKRKKFKLINYSSWTASCLEILVIWKKSKYLSLQANASSDAYEVQSLTSCGAGKREGFFSWMNMMFLPTNVMKKGGLLFGGQKEGRIFSDHDLDKKNKRIW